MSSRASSTARQRAGRLALRVAYWLAVLAVSIAILIGLILFLEARDNSQVGHGARLVPQPLKR